ncbi:MAG TPA: hypothetical protein PLV42_03735 [bacterium]|nr:hypothetical protein [bacterium]
MNARRDDMVRISFGIVFLLLFFIWATGGKFWTPLAIHFPAFHLLLAALTALALVPSIRRAGAALWGRLENVRYLFFPLCAFCGALLVDLLIFQGLPHIQDSIHYRIMADQLAHGRLDLPMVPYYEFFRYLYLVPDGEKIYSLFLPGYSLFLLPFTMLGIPFIANPILTAVNILVLGRIADDLFGPRVSAAAMTLAILSSFLMVMGGTGMAHPFCALMTLLTVFFFIRSRAETSKRRSLIFAAAAGSSLGWILFIRPQNATLLALPLALTALAEIRRSGTFLRGIALTLAFLPWLLLLLAYNFNYTHDLFSLRQDSYFNYSEPNDDCFGLGLGRGCPNADWMVLPDEGLTLTHAAVVTYHRLSLLIVNTFGHPLLFLLIPLAFFLRRGGRRELFIAAPFLATVGGYYFYYFDGNVFGPRYYYETTFFLMILAALGLVRLSEHIAASSRSRLYGAALGGFMAASYIFYAAVVLPPILSTYALDYWGVSRSLSQTAQRMNIHNAVIFVDNEELIGSGFAVMRHDDWDKNDIIFVRDLGIRSNSALLHYYRTKGRTFYRARYDSLQTHLRPPTITPLADAELPADYIVAEMEDKRYPLRGEPDYCNEYPNRPDLSRYVSFPPPDKLGIGFSKKAFFCRFRHTDEYYTFGQNILVAGRYTIEFVGVTGPEMGRFRVFIDETPVGTIDFTGARYEKVSRQVTADLTAGFRFIRLEPEDRTRDTYFLIDFVEFFRKPAE